MIQTGPWHFSSIVRKKKPTCIIAAVMDGTDMTRKPKRRKPRMGKVFVCRQGQFGNMSVMNWMAPKMRVGESMRVRIVEVMPRNARGKR